MLLNCSVGEDSWVPWTARRSNQSILKEISRKYSLEGLMLNLNLQYFGHPMQRTDSLEKTLMLGKTEDKRRRGRQEEIVRWHHWSYGHEFEQARGVGNGQGDLVCCSPWGRKELDTTEWLNWTELNCFVTHVDFSWGPVLSCLPCLCSLAWQTHPHPQLSYHVHTHDVPSLYFQLSPLVWPSDWYTLMPTGLVL